MSTNKIVLKRQDFLIVLSKTRTIPFSKFGPFGPHGTCDFFSVYLLRQRCKLDVRHNGVKDFLKISWIFPFFLCHFLSKNENLRKFPDYNFFEPKELIRIFYFLTKIGQNMTLVFGLSILCSKASGYTLFGSGI